MDEISEPDFDVEDFADIIAKDDRYDARAYVVLSLVISTLTECKCRASGEDILDEFREYVLDLYGPLSFRVLDEWGLHQTEDIGEMMLNLVESGRVSREEGDSIESFASAYDFKEAFLGPYCA